MTQTTRQLGILKIPQIIGLGSLNLDCFPLKDNHTISQYPKKYNYFNLCERYVKYSIIFELFRF